MDRRRFLKYGATAAAAAGAAVAGYYGTSGIPRPTSSMRMNNPPVVSEINIKPRYINPTTECTIQLSHDSYDPDSDPLTTTWLIDHKEVSHEHDYSTKLSEGEHWVDLHVSDGIEERGVGSRIIVEPDQIYPRKSLYAKYKGVNYCAGDVLEAGLGMPTPTEQAMEEHLQVIHDELGCNAIIITGGAPYYERNIIECAKLAVKAFDRVELQPRYFNATPEATVENIGRFAREVKVLRDAHSNVVYNVGHEFGFETAIIPGSNWDQRLERVMKSGYREVTKTLPTMFDRIMKVCEENYGYPIDYSAWWVEARDNLIPYSNPIFESITVDAFLEDVNGLDETHFSNLFSRLKRQYGKPVQSGEWGCFTYTGAARLGGVGMMNRYMSNAIYNEDEQPKYIERYCLMSNETGLDGIYYSIFWDCVQGNCISIGLVNNGRNRRKGFYMYKCYKRTGT